MTAFVVIDVETANRSLSSICQIGVAKFENGAIAKQWKTLVDPDDYFDEACIYIHGISEEDVIGQPKANDVYSDLIGFIGDNVVVAHTGFDRSSLRQSFAKYGLDLPKWEWLDSSMVARRAWPEVAYKGYGLSNLAARLNIQFCHHDALEDAIAAGKVLMRAIEDSGKDIDWWIKRVKRGIKPDVGSKLAALEVNKEGVLYGETVVFTGALSFSREAATVMALGYGCEVAKTVNKKVTLLVVGDQDLTKLAGHKKSSKHRKAEEMIIKGQQIRILKESDFVSISSVDGE